MKISYAWKKQLLICIVIFLALAIVGYLIKFAFLIAIGIIIVGISAVIAERAMRCPECKTSVFKEVMERGARKIKCPKCEAEITLE